MTENLQAALDFVARGWYPIPLCWPDGHGQCGCGRNHDDNNIGKAPLVGSGYQKLRPDANQVRRWWAQWPQANVGVLLEASGLVFVGPDSPQGAEYVKEHGAPPTAVRQSNHPAYLYRRPKGRYPIATTKILDSGLDVKSNGYCVAHGKHRLGADIAVDFADAIAEAPAWIAELLGELTGGNGHRTAPAIEGAIRDGQRNDTLTSLAGTMRRRGMTPEAIEAALLVENQRCDPPLPERDVCAVARSVGKYTPAEERHKLTDLGNAERLVARYGQDLRWCEVLGGWHVWDGRRWKLDTTGAIQRMAQATARAIYEEAAQCDEPEDRAKIAKHAMASESAGRQRAMLDLAWSQPGIAVTPDVWDRDPWLLNVNNGTVDLRAGAMREHRRDDLLTKLAPVDYAPGATAPTWLAHLERFLPDADVRRQVQRDLGLALVGETLEEALAVWYGTGANGKSTTSQTLERILGDYAQSAAPNLLVASRHENHPTEIADLRGARLVFSVEIGDNRNMDEAKVKMLTGGDTKKARLMRQDFFEFAQTFSIAMLVNHLPNISGTDEGIWRRIRLIPWGVRISDAERRPQAEILTHLVAEGAGILRWLLEGLADWQRDHRWIADAVTEATAGYRAEQDRLGAFLTDCCEMGPHYTVGVSDFYDTYNQWCEENGQEAVGKVQAGKLLRQRGIIQRRDTTGKARRWIGVRFLTTSDKVSETSAIETLSREDGKSCQNLSDADGLTETERHYREMAEREEVPW